jgi:YVTN family beta-propeller protein
MTKVPLSEESFRIFPSISAAAPHLHGLEGFPEPGQWAWFPLQALTIARITPELMNAKIFGSFPEIRLRACPALLLVFALTAFFEAKATDPQNTVVATVNVGSLPGYLVCSPDNKFVYVTISGGIAVINTATNELSTNFSLPGTQTFVAISGDGQTLYASDIANTGNGVQVISIANQSVTTLLPFEYPTRLALSPDGTELWVSNSTNDSQGGLYIIDTSTNQVTGGPIQVSNESPAYIVFTPDGTNVYATYSTADTITPYYLVQIDTSTQAVLNADVAGKTLRSKVLDGPLLLSMNPNGKALYAEDQSGPYPSVMKAVNLSTDKARNLYSPLSNTDQRITPNGKYLYLLNQGGGPNIPGTIVSITTTQGLAAGPTATVGVGPISIGIRPDGKRAYVSNQSDGTVTVINIQP